ncbi:FAD-dependent oxidoreductase [Synechococcales cyanobacterium C]|uniref:NADH:ubiquinone reductase (non-electrogenic) n=1 Tax=Petrachloros mirabilis ULC683 TaxID=2781853 RepID=A0A8K1ZXD1_9CYAN|nr:NAD(P)/FAD-dependent oxidoreductase [Petrachloros mirabilis]NCJ06929.1 FAD-dependent oxidoreductase [Petrachloros mirabilis ULC683]
MRRTRIVILGAGFAGLQAAQSLAGVEAEVWLIDRQNYHTFVPLLYQVATAQLEPYHIAYPVRRLLRRAKNVNFCWAEILQIEADRQVVVTDRGEFAYDFLVVATGSRAQFLGISGAAEYAFALKTLADAIALRNQILTCFERATQILDPQARQALLSFVIVGGGTTGVEVAGALNEWVKGALRRDFPTLDAHSVQITLVHAGTRLFPEFPDALGDFAVRHLQRLGVTVMLETRVCGVSADWVELEQGQILPTATPIWAAGLAVAHPKLSLDVTVSSTGKLWVQSTLQLADYDNIYALGDLAHVLHRGQPLAGVAPEALQQGVTVAQNLKRQLRGVTPQPFRYFQKGRLAIIGGYSGVGRIAGVNLTGFLAWSLWLLVHLIYLPGYRNRLFVLLTWLQSYVRRDRSVGHILRSASSTQTVTQPLKSP